MRFMSLDRLFRCLSFCFITTSVDFTAAQLQKSWQFLLQGHW